MEPKIFVATKALIVHKGKMLIPREAGAYPDGTNAGKFDVPGGRWKPSEHFDEVLKRKVREETELDIEIEHPVAVGKWRPVVRGESWQIVGIFFLCRATSANVTLSADHDAYEWIDPNDYRRYPLIDNLKQIFEEYIRRYAK